jgi:hypothetical protein
MTAPGRGPLHHVELWVPDLTRAEREWGWLLGRLGYAPFQDRPAGRPEQAARRDLPPRRAVAGHDGEDFVKRGGLSRPAPSLREDDGRRSLLAIARVTVFAQLKSDQLLNKGEQFIAVVEQRTPSRREWRECA